MGSKSDKHMSWYEKGNDNAWGQYNEWTPSRETTQPSWSIWFGQRNVLNRRIVSNFSSKINRC